MKYVIVGGVAGGATAAARIRRISEDSEIVLFEKGAHISYANCGLPYYIGGVIEDRNRLFVQTPEAFPWTLDGEYGSGAEKIEIVNEQRKLHFLL